MINTILGSLCLFIIWERVGIWPQIRPRKIPGVGNSLRHVLIIISLSFNLHFSGMYNRERGYAKLKYELLKMLSSGVYLEGFVALNTINMIYFSHSMSFEAIVDYTRRRRRTTHDHNSSP